jgi:hypothetical protein
VQVPRIDRGDLAGPVGRSGGLFVQRGDEAFGLLGADLTGGEHLQHVQSVVVHGSLLRY